MKAAAIKLREAAIFCYDGESKRLPGWGEEGRVIGARVDWTADA